MRSKAFFTFKSSCSVWDDRFLKLFKSMKLPLLNERSVRSVKATLAISMFATLGRKVSFPIVFVAAFCRYWSAFCTWFQERQFYLYALYNKNKPRSDQLLSDHGNVYFRVSTMFWVVFFLRVLLLNLFSTIAFPQKSPSSIKRAVSQ